MSLNGFHFLKPFLINLFTNPSQSVPNRMLRRLITSFDNFLNTLLINSAADKRVSSSNSSPSSLTTISRFSRFGQYSTIYSSPPNPNLHRNVIRFPPISRRTSLYNLILAPLRCLNPLHLAKGEKAPSSMSQYFNSRLFKQEREAIATNPDFFRDCR
jgi:hypothetical protein